MLKTTGAAGEKPTGPPCEPCAQLDSERRCRQVMDALPAYPSLSDHRHALEAARLNRHALDLTSDAVLVSGPDRLILSVNNAFEAITGYNQEEVAGRSCALLQGAKTSTDTVLQIRAALDAPRAFSGELLNYRKDGTPFWNALSINPVLDSGGQLTHFIAILRDVTERKNLHLQRKLAFQVFAQSREAIIVTDAQANIVMANQAFTDISGYTQAEVLGTNPRMSAASLKQENFYLDIAETIRTKGRWQGEVRNWRKDGTDYPERLSITTVRDNLGEVCNYIATFSDISEQKAARERIEWLSHYDELTGLPNRARLAERCGHDIRLAQQDGRPVTMLMLGVDRFKLVNDTLGRAQGDQVLKQLAQRLTQAVREQDTVARVSGDEFLLLLPGTDAEAAMHLADKLMQTVARPYSAGGTDLGLTASMGVAMYPSDGQDFEALFKCANVAMHQAEELGRGKCRFFSAEMFESAMADATLLTALRSATTLDQLQLHYQPFVDLQTGQIGGMEALLRWTHPELGSVSPARFIPIAERSGLIVEIGAWVFRQACRDMRDWLDRGIKAPPVSVNISPVQFRDARLLQDIEGTMAEFAIPPNRVCIEVTEGALMDDVTRSEVLLRSLKTLGLKLSLDDFGTGYSSLSYLKHFPFDKVKIDQSFVRGLSDNPQDAVIAKVVISMAHGLGLHVIAEGVETEAQCEFMRANMCDQIQGYFFSRPVPREQMEAQLLADRRLAAHLMRVRTKVRTLLLVDDDPNIVASLTGFLRRDGYRILSAGSGQEGLGVLARSPVDIIVSDHHMPGMTGVEFLRQAKTLYPDTMRIVLSGQGELQAVTDAINEGTVNRFLTKPWNDAQLCNFISEAFQHKELADENRQLNLKIRTANQELASSNRQLQEVLGQKQRQIAHSELNLNVVREALQRMPVPVIGLDDEGLIAFINAQAQTLFSASGTSLGAEIAITLPELGSLLADTAEGEYGHAEIGGHAYRVQWHRMGERSASSGKIVTLSRHGQGALQ